MDVFGILRRVAGAIGVGLVALGVSTQEEGAALSSNVEALIGGALFMIDFVPSIFAKIKGAFSGESK